MDSYHAGNAFYVDEDYEAAAEVYIMDLLDCEEEIHFVDLEPSCWMWFAFCRE